MRLFGYELDSAGALLTLRETTLEVSVDEAKMLAEFFTRCARAMSTNPSWEHEHFRGGELPDIVVYKASSEESND